MEVDTMIAEARRLEQLARCYRDIVSDAYWNKACALWGEIAAKSASLNHHQREG